LLRPQPLKSGRIADDEEHNSHGSTCRLYNYGTPDYLLLFTPLRSQAANSHHATINPSSFEPQTSCGYFTKATGGFNPSVTVRYDSCYHAVVTATSGEPWNTARLYEYVSPGNYSRAADSGWVNAGTATAGPTSSVACGIPYHGMGKSETSNGVYFSDQNTSDFYFC